MKKSTTTLAATVFALGAASVDVQAEEKSLSYSMILTAASDYMFRGISYTDNDATANIYQEVGYGMAYLAFWTSNIDFGAYGPWEQDIYVGIRPTTGPVNWDLATYYYMYGNRDGGRYGSTFDIDYFEFKLGATASPWENLTLGTTLWLTPDQGYAATDNVSIEGAISYGLPRVAKFSPTISGLVGYSDSGTNRFYPTGFWLGQQSYTYWNAGLSLAVDKLSLDFRYWDTSIPDRLSDERFVLSASFYLFP